MQLLSLVPMLQTQDMAGTIAWYTTVLGFTLADRRPGWCRLARDQAVLMFMENDHLGAALATATQYIVVDDVMALWSSIQGRCTAEWGPEEMPYGMLEFAVTDPNGYLLSFGQTLR